MKKTVLIFIFGLLASTVVSQEIKPEHVLKKENKTSKTESAIQGTWVWVKSFGTWSGNTTPESTGDKIRLKISKTAFKLYKNGRLDTKSDYALESGTSLFFSGLSDFLVLKGSSTKYIYEIKEPYLYLSCDCLDGASSTYIRK